MSNENKMQNHKMLLEFFQQLSDKKFQFVLPSKDVFEFDVLDNDIDIQYYFYYYLKTKNGNSIKHGFFLSYNEIIQDQIESIETENEESIRINLVNEFKKYNIKKK